MTPTSPVMRGDNAGAIRQAFRTHTGVAMKVSADPSGLVYTATRQETTQSTDSYTELIPQVRPSSAPPASVPSDSVSTAAPITGFVVPAAPSTDRVRRTPWDMTASGWPDKPIDRPHRFPSRLTRWTGCRWYRQTRFDFGVDLNMKTQRWNPLDSPQPAKPAGKTVDGPSIVLVDFKGGSYSDLVDWPNVHIVSSDPCDSIATIHRMYALMNDHRNARGRWDQKAVGQQRPLSDRHRRSSPNSPRSSDASGPTPSPKADRRPAHNPTELGELAWLCRTARMHLVVGMQRPDADFLNTEVRDSFGNKVSVGPISRIAAVVLFENAYTGRYVPRIKGRGMATGTPGSPRNTVLHPAGRHHDSRGSQSDCRAAPLAPAHPRYVPELPSDPTSASWTAITEARWFR